MEIITEKKYPIRNIWLLKSTTGILSIIPMLFFYFFIFNPVGSMDSSDLERDVSFPWIIGCPIIFLFILGAITPIIIKILQKRNFHYSLEDRFISLRQGVISKSNRSVPYGRIQGVFVNQSLFERIFGLASLNFEDFSNGGVVSMAPAWQNERFNKIGFLGNQVNIPGLKKTDAEALKEIILQKIKENPIEDSQSGL